MTSKVYTRQLLVLLSSIVVGSVGVGILNPLVPQLFSGAHALFPGLGYGVYGLLVATYPFCQFCSSFVLAGASDRLGRKRLLLLSTWGTGFGYLLFVIGLMIHSLPLVFVSRAFDGLTGGSIGITQAAIADITPPEVRSSRLGLIGGAFGLGLIIGPLLGGVLAAHYALETPFVAAAGIAALNALLLGRYLPEGQSSPSHAGVRFGRELLTKLTGYMRSPHIRSILSASFLYNGAMASFNTFFPVFLIERFHFDTQQIGLFYTGVGVLYAANQFWIVPRINQRWSAERLLPIGVVALAVAMLGFAGSFLLIGLILPELLFILSNGTNQSNIVGLLSTRSGADEQGKILGLNSSLIALAQTLMPPLAGLVATGFSGGLPLLISAVLMLIAATTLLPLVRGKAF